MQTEIPLYSADGELREWISESQMWRLDALGVIRIVQHRKGHVSRCIMHRRPGDSEPVKPADYLGTRYSFREHLENGHLCWRLKRLGRGEELRPIFMAVVADCMGAR